MFSTCIFCQRPLGTNQVLEEFPVGRRLAFDAHRGRLWVVCRRCERWNLAPLEERWEALEAAERLFRDTRMRVSTENIGLARHPEGLELVRIGQPLRPEFAAWRYGDQFGRRRRRALMVGAGAAAAFGTVATVGFAAGAITGIVLAQSPNLVQTWRNLRTVLTVNTAEGERLKLKQSDVWGARLSADAAGEWSLVLGRYMQRTLKARHGTGPGSRQRPFTGDEAQQIAGLIMPRLNAWGARASVVQDAVGEIEACGGPDDYLSRVLVNLPYSARARKAGESAGAELGNLALPTRLALEMALHEEQERRALEGELKALELAWQAAEEVAAIADDLLVSGYVRARLEQAREEAGPRGSA